MAKQRTLNEIRQSKEYQIAKSYVQTQELKGENLSLIHI